jgi:L-fucose mutarotase/ribose pyranase (RbsD/FucU family)
MSKKQKIILIAVLACLGFILMACESPEKEGEEGKRMEVTWEQKLLRELPGLGHRNWIVVADSAYPAQVSPGIEIVVSSEDHFAVLEKVLKAIDGSKHIRPRIYMDKELAYVTEDLAPGIEACRGKLEAMLKGREVKRVLHEELIARLDEVAKTFRILMIKTTLALPYTSVFMELDCGYWRSEAEAKMRESMK